MILQPITDNRYLKNWEKNRVSERNKHVFKRFKWYKIIDFFMIKSMKKIEKKIAFQSEINTFLNVLNDIKSLIFSCIKSMKKIEKKNRVSERNKHVFKRFKWYKIIDFLMHKIHFLMHKIILKNWEKNRVSERNKHVFERFKWYKLYWFF